METLPHPLSLFVKDLALRAPLSPADRDAIYKLPHTLRILETSAYALREADMPTHCGVLVSGFAFRQKIASDGGRQIMAILLPGDAIDLQNLFLDVSDHSIQMMTRGQLAMLRREDIQEIVRTRPGVRQAIFIKILAEASIFREWLVNLGQRQAPERVAHLLCELGFRFEVLGLAEKYGYELPITQEELGDATGITSVHVNRILKKLDASGFVTRNRRQISFSNWSDMRTIAGFNARYLHMQGK
ncbi:Crp/Fnr family transcriptional regulator [Croceicoccus sp. F390]|uniref:Crp/Fnr family transcriptional regulator n=1 Tax=Croceicoccus esteveae TaxID=3075597 RepID=A0ABU2ZK70_9SPHN|nr:Crp/Fnr family transcriptional regulator [Croceicoccus sp. F390]MDT0576998.1 Crp/Fnr family transcriptional regulator [Croceicoccus sp. F390]